MIVLKRRDRTILQYALNIIWVAGTILTKSATWIFAVGFLMIAVTVINSVQTYRELPASTDKKYYLLSKLLLIAIVVIGIVVGFVFMK